MKCTLFRVIVLAAGIFSLGFQIIGLFVPAWYRMQMRTEVDGDTMDVSISFGFFLARSCVAGLLGSDEVCASVTMHDVENQMHTGSNKGIIETPSVFI